MDFGDAGGGGVQGFGDAGGGGAREQRQYNNKIMKRSIRDPNVHYGSRGNIKSSQFGTLMFLPCSDCSTRAISKAAPQIASIQRHQASVC